MAVEASNRRSDGLEVSEEQAWDDQIARDFAPGGRAAAWRERV